jgi:ArsR family transcriptional regulator, arsenate/arsenite/antimonite-responsive transcriptional repressor / arsenate reductase (thioredoxin)
MMSGVRPDQDGRPLRVLFLCTGNSARSQIAEALLHRKSRGQFEVASAGVAPAAAVHPMTVDAPARLRYRVERPSPERIRDRHG